MQSQKFFQNNFPQLNFLSSMRGKEIVLGTICSGTEAPVFALRRWEELAKQHGNEFTVRHAFSCEIEEFKQQYIARNFDPETLFRDAENMGDDFAPNVYGNLKEIVRCDVLVAGTSCKDCSSLNAHKQDLREGRGESTRTYRGMLRYVTKHRPTIVVLENVSGAPWKHMVNDFHSIGYDSSFTRADTKKYGLPQTRCRGYLVAIARTDEQQGTSDTVAAEWVLLMKNMQTTLDTTVDQYLFAPDHPIIQGLRHRWSTYTPFRNVAWVRCQARHAKIRIEENLGFERWLTNWQENVRPHFLDMFWNDYFNTIQTNRVFDLLEINFLRELKQTGCDARFKAIVWDLSQNPDRGSRAKFGLTGCLTPRGMMFLTKRGGPIVGAEMLSLQGLPADGLCFGVESDAQLKDFAGNAMTVTVVGAAIGSALMLAGDRFSNAVEKTTTPVTQPRIGETITTTESVVSRDTLSNGTFCHACGNCEEEVATCYYCHTVRCVTCSERSREQHTFLFFDNPIADRHADATVHTVRIEQKEHVFRYTDTQRGKHIFMSDAGTKMVSDGMNWSLANYSCSTSSQEWKRHQSTEQVTATVRYFRKKVRALENIVGLRADAFLHQSMEVSLSSEWKDTFHLAECCRDKSHNVFYKNQEGTLFLHLDAKDITLDKEDCFVITKVPYFHEETDIFLRFDSQWRPTNFTSTVQCVRYNLHEQNAVEWCSSQHAISTTWRNMPTDTSASVLCEIFHNEGSQCDENWIDVITPSDQSRVRWLIDTLHVENTDWCEVDATTTPTVNVEFEYLVDSDILRKKPEQNDLYERQKRHMPKLLQMQRARDNHVWFVFDKNAMARIEDNEFEKLFFRIREPPRRFVKDIKLSSNKNDVETASKLDLPLRPEQRRSLTWMLQQEEAGTEFKIKNFYEEQCGPMNAQLMSTRDICCRGGVLCDDVGYGKTVISLALISHDVASAALGDWETDATLVVVPFHLATQWRDEVKKFMGHEASKRVLIVRNVKQWLSLTRLQVQGANIIVVCEKVLRSSEYWRALSIHGGRILTPDVTNETFEYFLAQEYNHIVNNMSHDKATIAEKAKQESQRFLTHQNLAYVQPTVLHGKDLQQTRMFGETKDSQQQDRFFGKTEIVVKEYLRSCTGKVRGLPLELFHFKRIVVDEFTYLKGLSRVVVAKGLKSHTKWLLSATSSFDTPQETAIVSNLLFGKNQRMKLHDMSVRYAQDFVDRFVRKNVAEIDEIPSVTLQRVIELSFFEKVLYTENVHFNNVVAPNFQQHKRARLSKTSTTEELVNLLNCSDMSDVASLLQSRKENILTNRRHLSELVHRALSMERKLKLDKEHTWLFWKTIEYSVGDKEFDDCVRQMLEQQPSDDAKGTSMGLRELTHEIRTVSAKFLGALQRHRFLKHVQLAAGNGAIVDINTGYYCPEGKNIFAANEPLISCEVGGSKIHSLLRLLRQNVEKQEKTIVMVQYYSLFQKMVKFLKGNKIRLAFESKHINKFQNNQYDVLLIMSNETVSGLNLTCANHMVFVHPLFLAPKEILAQETQFIGRAVRYGQEKKVMIYRFVARDTIES
jgi:SNF2 family DNA or RNA helicase/site-specific DNA-cytosine methylase